MLADISSPAPLLQRCTALAASSFSNEEKRKNRVDKFYKKLLTLLMLREQHPSRPEQVVSRVNRSPRADEIGSPNIQYNIVDYTKRHKQFAHIKAPVRFVYIEELDKKKLDTQILKDFVDGNKVNNEIMFGTSENIPIQCKLNLISNFTPSFETDSGVARRGLLIELTNKFLPKEEYEQNIKEKKGVYPIDDTLEAFIKTVEFKLAFLHILLPYAQKYHMTGLPHYNPVLSAFKEVCEDNDSIKDFVEQFYETTNDENDRVSKEEFLEMYRLHFKLKQVTWMNVLNDIKRCGLQYNRTLRVELDPIGDQLLRDFLSI